MRVSKISCAWVAHASGPNVRGCELNDRQSRCNAYSMRRSGGQEGHDATRAKREVVDDDEDDVEQRRRRR